MRALLLGILAVALAAQDGHMVRERHVSLVLPLRLGFDQDRAESLLPTVEESVVLWRRAEGSVVEPGQLLMRFDAERARGRLERFHLRVARVLAELARARLRREHELARLAREREDLERRILVAEQQLQQAQVPDPDEVALAEASVARARLDLARAQRQEQQAQEGLLDGRLSAEDLAESRRRTVAQQDQLALASARLQRARAGPDAALRARLQTELDRLRVRLGDDRSGLIAAQAAAVSRIAGELAADQVRLEEEHDTLYRYQRVARAATPLLAVEVLDADGEVLRRLRFAPAGSRVAPGWELADEAPWDEARGLGWLDGPGPLELREEDDWAPGLALVADGRRRWRLRPPPGAASLRVELGDGRAHNGILLRLGEEVFCRTTLAQGERLVAEMPLRDDGPLELLIGDEEPAAMRAPVSGLLLYAGGTGVGDRVRHARNPIIWLVERQHLVLRARVPQALASAFSSGASEEDEIAEDPVRRVQRGLAMLRLSVRHNGLEHPAQLRRVGAQPVPLDWAPTRGGRRRSQQRADEDLLARELELVPDEHWLAAWGLEGGLEAVARFDLPEGAWSLPVHLVAASGDDRGWVRLVDGSRRELRGFRMGERWIACAGLQGGEQLLPPGEVPDADSQVAAGAGVLGTVVPGRRTTLRQSGAWGRIASMAEDGATVAVGDVVLELYNPWIDPARQEMSARRAQQQHRVAQERRRAQAATADRERRELTLALAEARQARETARHLDPLLLHERQLAVAQARAATAAATDRLLRGGQRSDADARLHQELAQAQQEAGLAQRRAELDMAAARRGVDALRYWQTEAGVEHALATLALRAGRLQRARLEERNALLAAEQALARALEGNRWQANFERHRVQRAPVAGQLLWHRARNQRTGRMEPLARDATVWRGLALADIIDPAGMALRAELDERLLPRLELGMEVLVEFPQYGGRRLPAQLSSIDDRVLRAADSDPGAASAGRRVVGVEAIFEVPPDLAGRVLPGTQGRMVVE